MNDQPLAGLSVLVVEDESIVAFLIEEMLLDLGCANVWLAGSVKDALAVLQAKSPDVAVLDVNLGGQEAYPLASSLEAARIPFVFATGYGPAGIDEPWTTRPVVQKPFQLEMLKQALLQALAK